ncbi:MAG: hypothetical protein JJ902_15850 [Roseibium sp.]|nr:hypothetical protein [Roseibium sp.]
MWCQRQVAAVLFPVLVVFAGGGFAQEQNVQVDAPQPGGVEPVMPEANDEAGEPLLIGVDAPDVFETSNLGPYQLLVGIEAQDLSPLIDADIQVQVLDMDGRPIEVPISNTLTPVDILFGDSLIGIDIRHAIPFGGSRFPVKVCAFSEKIAGNPCAVVDLFDAGSPLDEVVKDYKDLVEKIKKMFPGIGCRCKAGVIRMSAKQKNHGGLGTFTNVVGGASYGPYHRTDKAKKLITSTYKFEPHFEIEIVNRPKKPGGLDAKTWAALETVFPYLCPEGQRLNGTHTFHAGTPREVKLHKKQKVGQNTVEFPYKETEDIKKFIWDAHGYRQTGKGKTTVKGNVKAHDKNIVHWLDAPGLNMKGQKVFLKISPVHAQYYFHSFVHGSTGKKGDNCDCFFGLKTGVLDKNAEAVAPTILKKPVCK